MQAPRPPRPAWLTGLAIVVAATLLGWFVFINPDRPAIFFNQPVDPLLESRTLIDQGRYAEAVTAADRALQADPADPEGHFLRGEALRLQGRAQDALHAYDRALEFDPANPEVYLSRAQAWLLLEPPDCAEARADWDAYLALRPADPPAEFAAELDRVCP
jgi:cytochrome c-type biogenesis protein CcmH/NrfG